MISLEANSSADFGEFRMSVIASGSGDLDPSS